MSGRAYLQALDALCAELAPLSPARRSLAPKPKSKHPDRCNKHGRRQNALTPKRVAHAAQIAKSNVQAGAMLGCNPQSFSRRCYELGIETPQARKRRQHSEATT